MSKPDDNPIYGTRLRDERRQADLRADLWRLKREQEKTYEQWQAEQA